MKGSIARWSLPVLVAACLVGANAMTPPPDRPLAHMVFFTLKDRSAESRARFVESCQTYLGDIEGTTYFSVGTIAEDVEEPVSVKDFDVGLHVVFESKEAKEAYLTHPQHLRFVEENRPLFEKVRVFDTYLAEPAE